MTRFERIMNGLTVGERMAVSGAMFLAQDMSEEFKRRYGDYGLEQLNRLLDPNAKEEDNEEIFDK
jgi:hypothetical protein